MIRTGIPVLDEQLKGGIPIGKTFTFYMAPGINGDVFMLQTVYANLSENGVCYFLTSNCSPDVARTSFREYGWDLTPHAARFAIIDGYSAELGVPSQEPFVVDDPGSIASVDRTISGIIDLLAPGDMIAISSLSSIFDSCRSGDVTDQTILDYARKWNKMAVLNGGVMLYGFSDRDYDRSLVEQIKEGLCNATVMVGGPGEQRTYGDNFKLHTCDWARPPEWPTPYKVIKPGGVRAYIPKILVTGPRGSGKSTFVHTASLLSSGKSVSVDRAGTTVALDYANVTLRGLTIDLFGTPGQARFNPILRTLAKDAMGVVLIVDSTDQKSFERVSEILKIACGKTTPYIVAANKQDLNDAMDPEQIRKKLGVPPKVPVIGLTALDPADVMESLEKIISKIVEAR
jgi:small GTP-binding protein